MHELLAEFGANGLEGVWGGPELLAHHADPEGLALMPERAQYGQQAFRALVVLPAMVPDQVRHRRPGSVLARESRVVVGTGTTSLRASIRCARFLGLWSGSLRISASTPSIRLRRFQALLNRTRSAERGIEIDDPRLITALPRAPVRVGELIFMEVGNGRGSCQRGLDAAQRGQVHHAGGDDQVPGFFKQRLVEPAQRIAPDAPAEMARRQRQAVPVVSRKDGAAGIPAIGGDWLPRRRRGRALGALDYQRPWDSSLTAGSLPFTRSRRSAAEPQAWVQPRVPWPVFSQRLGQSVLPDTGNTRRRRRPETCPELRPVPVPRHPENRRRPAPKSGGSGRGQDPDGNRRFPPCRQSAGHPQAGIDQLYSSSMRLTV